jgi:hypothetical protein
VSVILYESALLDLLNGRQGDVAADLAQKGRLAETLAKQQASGRPGPNVVTGRLRSSITWEIGVDARGLYMDYGTNVEYGRYLELGLRNGVRYPFLSPVLPAVLAS